MEKKIKISELEDEAAVAIDASEQNGQDLSKIEVEKLDHIKLEKKRLKERIILPPKKIVTARPTPTIRIPKNIVFSFFGKVIGLMVVLAIADLISHFFKFFDNIDVFNVENYHSIYWPSDIHTLITRVLLLVTCAFILTPKADLELTSQGIFCTRPQLVNGLFLLQTKIFVHWEDIAEVQYRLRMFEPYLILFSKDEIKIGHIHFFPQDPRVFFELVKEYAGENHPLYQVKNNSQFF